MAFPLKSSNLNQLFGALGQQFGADKKPAPVDESLGAYTDEEIIELWDKIKVEAIDHRWIWERQWQRNLWYVLGRQWIEYISQYGGWREKRMAPSIPRPVTNICKDTLKAIRSIFTGIDIGVNVRPNGSDPKNVQAAATANELAPVLHETHRMSKVMREFDFWLIVCGNAFLNTFVDYDLSNGRLKIEHEACSQCGQTVPTYERPTMQEPCVVCQGTAFEPAVDDNGQPMVTYQTKACTRTEALSPLEIAFSNSYSRFEDLPYIVRLRWRTKYYYENHPQLKNVVKDISWSKSPTDRSLLMKMSLNSQNDLGTMPTYLSESSHSNDEDGVTEYEVQMKPCEKYPEGLVFRIVGEKSPMVLHLEDTEALPGPLPYKDADGDPLWTWTHAAYEEMGGRVLGSGPIDLIIQKQDQLNQLDSMMLMTLSRLAAGGWIIPKGSEIENVTKLSTPGVIVRWNPLTVQGNAKPERFEGAQINQSWFVYREAIIADAEKLTGTYDIVKGAKPAGVEAFSALQLLVERSQSSFATVFTARGEAYKDWFKFAIELEREFGPDERTQAVMSPARTWTFKTFQRAKLSGSIDILVEDGSNQPKTSLGMRASVQQAQALGMLDMKNPDTVYQSLRLYGLASLVPNLDVAVQSALQIQQAFEEWIVDKDAMVESTEQHTEAFTKWQQDSAGKLGDPAFPQAPPPNPLDYTPLKWRAWYNPSIHRQEFEKWANSDRVRMLMQETPAAEEFLGAYYQQIKQAEMQAMIEAQGPQMPAQVSGPGGASVALQNSNQNSTKNPEPKGTGEGAQNAGPR